ncbi:MULTISPECIES: tryptophan halogenase family protein [Shewanella]|uniref:tryptophan halogenase family protein n=1 Tax=Shewanella TaxID=22 RepID=UPI0021D82450|nr:MULTISPECIES: tryptophan halogenase family protein [Shewanella]MCU8013539.1 tryptophan 7-halogenase [Shewanella sp. SM74]WVI92080.1 tryptophan halogenase family protein [Shewanella oncorhynchi]
MKVKQAIRKIIILGGGTAGWMAAAALANNPVFAAIELCLVESDNIGTIGVGEGSTPHLKRFMDNLGISEKDWMEQCHASYKTGIDFINWNGDGQQYFHPFYCQMDVKPAEVFFINANARRRGHGSAVKPDAFFSSGVLAKRNLSPRPNKALPCVNEYGYHFDATELANYLKEYACQRGVKHLIGDVIEVSTTQNQHIDALMLANGERLNADFFIDASGFSAKLIHKTLGVPFQSFANELLNDSAVTVPVPVPALMDSTQTQQTQTLQAKAQHAKYHTRATALSAGWLWQIPLTHRLGNGYVYSSRHLSANAAAKELLHSVNLPESTQVRFLKMRVGVSDKAWHNNVLAIGLAQSFIEPLEATSIMMTQFTLEKFMSLFERYQLNKQAETLSRQTLNQAVMQLVLGIKDYIQAHYVTSQRSEPYWLAARKVTISQRLTQLLQAWYQGEDFDLLLYQYDQQLAYFRPSWYALLAGMDYRDPKLKRPFEPISAEITAQAIRYSQTLVEQYFQPKHP